MGLTDLGRAAIAEMNALGMIVDVSLCSKQTTLDAAALSTKPIIATHVNAEALTPVTRNKSEEELIAIAATGGVIGVTPIRAFLDTNRDGSAGIDDMIAHIEYMVTLVGIDRIGISSDSDLDGWEKTSYYYAGADLADSTTVALLNSAAIDFVGSGIAGLVPDGVVSIETRTEPAQRGDSPSIRGG